MQEKSYTAVPNWFLGLLALFALPAIYGIISNATNAATTATKVESVEKTLESVVTKLDGISQDLSFIKGQMAGMPDGTAPRGMAIEVPRQQAPKQ